MSWAARRRFLILLIIGGATAAFLVVVLTSTFYKNPSCTDNVQNQDEDGIDCGGSCAYLCLSQHQPPTVLFTKVLTNSAGRADVIALVENKNVSAAAKNVPYSIKLYSATRGLIQEVTGTLDLPPGMAVPVFIPGVASASASPGKKIVTNAFLSIEASSPKWFSMTSATDSRIVPEVLSPILGGTTAFPRIEVALRNSSVTTLSNVRVVTIVHDDKGSVMAASSTIVPSIPGQGQSVAIFTWNEAFPRAPSLIEVIPIIPLP